VRSLERQIGAICRKSVVKIVGHQWTHVVVTPELVREHLKRRNLSPSALKALKSRALPQGWPLPRSAETSSSSKPLV